MNIYKIVYYLLIIFMFFGCGEDEEQLKKEHIYFYDANTSFDNGDYEKAINSYKAFIKIVDNEKNATVQLAYLQLARIFFSRQNYELAKSYADKVSRSNLYLETYLLEEETVTYYDDRGSSRETEINAVGGYYYSLKGKAKTIIGLCHLENGDYDSAIDNFEDIKPKIDSYYFLGLTYGLKGNIDMQSKYFKKNLEKGSYGLIETTEWLNNNPEN